MVVISRYGSKDRLILPPNGGWVAALLVALVVWLPLPHGSVTPSAVLVYRTGAAVVLGAALLSRGGVRWVRRLDLALIALVGIGILGLAQSLAWPQGVVALLSPGHHHLAAATFRDVAGTAEEVAGRARWGLSLAPEASRGAALSVFAAAALLVAGSRAGQRSRHRVWLAATILAAAVVQVIYGLRPWLAGEVPRLRGTWVNPDHLAVQLEIALCVGAVVVLGLARRLRDGGGSEHGLALLGAALIAWLVVLAGLLLTGSRAGLLAALAGCLVVACAIAARRTRSLLIWLGLVVGAVLAALFATTVGRVGLERLLSTSVYDLVVLDRGRVWREALALVGDFPLLGTGLGSFEEAYPLVESVAPSSGLWGRAHNDFLELLICGGALGLALGLLALLGVARPLFAGVRRGLRTIDRLAALGALAALAAVALHELFDFGATLPANSGVLAILVGAGASVRLRPGAARRRRRAEGSDSRAAGRPAS